MAQRVLPSNFNSIISLAGIADNGTPAVGQIAAYKSGDTYGYTVNTTSAILAAVRVTDTVTILDGDGSIYISNAAFTINSIINGLPRTFLDVESTSHVTMLSKSVTLQFGVPDEPFVTSDSCQLFYIDADKVTTESPVGTFAVNIAKIGNYDGLAFEAKVCGIIDYIADGAGHSEIVAMYRNSSFDITDSVSLPDNRLVGWMGIPTDPLDPTVVTVKPYISHSNITGLSVAFTPSVVTISLANYSDSTAPYASRIVAADNGTVVFSLVNL